PVKTHTNVVVQEPVEIQIATPAVQPGPVTVRVDKTATATDVIVQPRPKQEFYFQGVQSKVDQESQANQRMAVVYAKGSVGQVMGVYVSPVPPAMAAQLRLKPRTGLVVEGVMQGSAAEQAGIQQYDVIDRVGDQG